MRYRIWIMISRGEAEESFVIPQKDVHSNLNSYTPSAKLSFLLKSTMEE